jgi:hypothetical protein
MSRPTCRTMLALLCLSVLAARAANADEGILIYGPEDAGMSEQQRAAALLEATIGGEDLPGSSIHILDLPFPSADPVWIAGDARVVPCSDPAFESEDLAALLSSAIESIDGLDYEEGKRTLDRAITALPCATQPVERQVLIDLYYFRGIAGFHLDDRDGARQSFQYALAIDREKTWDTNYPPEPQQIFLLAKEDAIGLDRVDIGHDVAGLAIADFNFDGLPLDSASAGIMQVIPGMHLVQYNVDGTPYSRLVEVRKGGPAALVTRSGLTAAVLGGPETLGMLPAARASLRALVQGRNLQRAYVVVLVGDDGGRIYQYDETYTTLQENVVATGTGSTRTGATGGSSGGGSGSPGGLTLGLGGFAYAHDSPYASFALRGHIKLYKGLELELGGGPNITSYTASDGAQWAAVLPYLRAGARVRIGSKAFKPYVGAALLMNFWSETVGDGVDKVKLTQVSPGGVLFGGFDAHLTDALYINVDLDVGYAYRVWVAVHGGIGFRF